MAKQPTAKNVETLTHDEARRKNIPMPFPRHLA